LFLRFVAFVFAFLPYGNKAQRQRQKSKGKYGFALCPIIPSL